MDLRLLGLGLVILVVTPIRGSDLNEYAGDKITSHAEWSPRAGLQVVDLDSDFYLMGGRTPMDPNQVPVFGASEIWADVWRSSNQGATWEQIVATDAENHWPARACFQAVRKGDEMFVLGGQNFNVIDNPFPGGPPQISVSDFFNDVWSSSDGVNWTPDDSQRWLGRACRPKQRRVSRRNLCVWWIKE